MAIQSGDYKVECVAELVSCTGDVLHEVERRQTISKKDRIGIAVILDMDDEITAGTN